MKSDRAERQVRVQLDFSEEALSRLQKLKSLADARTNAEVIRNALRFYEWLLVKKQEQARVVVMKDGSSTEIELLV